MDELIIFMENSKVNDLVKSTIIHFYFVYVHPLVMVMEEHQEPYHIYI